MRWIVREGQERGRGERVYDRFANDSWDERKDAERVAECGGRTDCSYGADSETKPGPDGKHGRVIRLLSPDEAKRKAIAAELRTLAKAWRVEADDLHESGGHFRMLAGDLERRADELWPARGGRVKGTFVALSGEYVQKFGAALREAEVADDGTTVRIDVGPARGGR